MNRLIVGVAVIALSACSTIEKEGSREITSLTSPDGFEFTFMPVYERGVTDITVRIAWPTHWARTDGLNQAVPYAGTDLILSGGTATRKPGEIMETFNDFNAYGNFSASPDYVIGELGFPRNHLDETVEIASELLTNPQMDEQWLERIKQGFKTNQSNLYIESGNLMWSAARWAVLNDTPLLQALDVSDLDTIDAVTRDEILAWHGSTFTRVVKAITVTGAITKEDAGNVVDRLLEGLPEGEPMARSEDKADFSPVTVLLHLPDAEKTTMGIVGQLPPTSDGGDYEDLLALTLFGSSEGPLFQALRTELRATYGIQAGYTNYTRELRPFYLFGEVDTTQLAEVSQVAIATYENFRLNPDLTGLEELKLQVADDARKDALYVDVAARLMMEALLDGFDPVVLPAVHERFAAVTAQSIKTRLQEAFPPGSALMVMAVSPDPDALPGACVITAPNQAMNCR